MIHAKRVVCYLLVVLALVSVTVWSAPYFGDGILVEQPDGTLVPVRVWGDEFYVRTESLDGYTLARDPQTGFICYGQMNSDNSDFASTGEVYDGKTLEAQGVQAQALPLALRQRIQQRVQKVRAIGTGLKLDKQVRLNKIMENRRLLLKDSVSGMDGMSFAANPSEPGTITVMGAVPAPAPLLGSVVGITLLIQFPDVLATIPQTEINNYCNMVGYTGNNNNGSIRDYFNAVSNGNLVYTNVVTAYYTAKNNRSYYTDETIGYGTRAGELINEALTALEAQAFDFSQLSASGGRFKAINAFYAGNTVNAWAKGLWPHQGYYGSFYSSRYNVRSGSYQITHIGSSLSLGTFCHENGHMICSYPDLYDYHTDDINSRGVGGYCLMCSSGSTNPVPPCAWLRSTTGWETVIDITDVGAATTYSHASNSFTSYKYSNLSYTNEFFFIESNIKSGRRSGIPDEGLLIWHVDTAGSNDNQNMTPASHYKVSVEQADGLFEMERNVNGGGSNDLFHAGNKVLFDATTTPNSNWWSGEESGLKISEIGAVGAPMTFKAMNTKSEFWAAPAGVLRFNGLSGGPLNPASHKLTLYNNSAARTINFSIAANGAWFALTQTSGALAPQTSVDITITPNADLDLLTPRTVENSITITDTGASIQYVRKIILTIQNRLCLGCWPLDETAGAIAYDQAGAMNGTLSNEQSFATNSAAGVFNSALSFDGANDYIDLPNGLQDFSSGFSLSLWAYPTAVKSWSRFLDIGNGPASDNILLCRQGSTNDLTLETYQGAVSRGKLTATNTIGLNAWQHFAVTVDQNGNGIIYKNGALIKSGIVMAPTLITRTNNYIGRSNWSADAYYQGRLDEVRIYNYPLSAAEIGQLYGNGGPSVNFSPAANAPGVYADARLNWLAGPLNQRSRVYFGEDAALVQNADRRSPLFMGITTGARFDPPLLLNNKTYFWRVDDELTNGQTITGTVMKFQTAGAITRQVWNNITGTAVSALTGSANYPAKPDLVDYKTLFEAPANWNDNYGTRMHGYLIPRTGGNYNFWIAGDDYCELWLSADADPAHAVKIAEVPGHTESRVWNTYAAQKSGAKSLVAGKRYYIMALHKESGGGDNLAVAWQGPDSAALSVIDGSFLQPWYGNKTPRLTNGYQDKGPAAEGASYQATIAGQATDPDGQSVNYRKLAGPGWLNVAADGILSGTPDYSADGENYFVLGAGDDKGGIDDMLVKITVADKHAGQRGLLDLVDLAGNWLKQNPDHQPAVAISDLDSNKTVNMIDLAMLTGNWLTGQVNGLLTYYPMDDNGGLLLRDAYGNHDGVLQNNMDDFNWVAGYQGGGLNFNGVDNTVYCGAGTAINNLSTFSINLWFKAGKVFNATSAHLICQRDQSSNIWTLYFSPAGGGALGGMVMANSQAASCVSNFIPQPGVWYQVTMTYDDGSDRKVRLYVNGTEPGYTTQQTAVGSRTVNMTVPVIIGNRLGSDRAFDGVIDDVALFNRILTPAEILALQQTDSGLAAWWPVNHTAGALLNDTTGRNDGLLVNMTDAAWIPAVFGNGLQFDGVDDWVQCGADPSLADLPAFTVSLWFKATVLFSNSTAAHLICQRDQTTYTWVSYLQPSSGGALSGSVMASAQAATTVTSFIPALETWYHLAMTYDDAGDRKVRIYINGTETGYSSLQPAMGNRLVNTTLPVVLGNRLGGGRPFNGALDNIRIYNRALTRQEIENLQQRP